MAEGAPEHQEKINFNLPRSARIWNYGMGGKNNYPVDQTVDDAYLQLYPYIATMATQSRQFLIRAVHFLASEAGIRQFLDLGTGLRTMQNTHEIAQSVAKFGATGPIDAFGTVARKS